jgi:hypothetical protein
METPPNKVEPKTFLMLKVSACVVIVVFTIGAVIIWRLNQPSVNKNAVIGAIVSDSKTKELESQTRPYAGKLVDFNYPAFFDRINDRNGENSKAESDQLLLTHSSIGQYSHLAVEAQRRLQPITEDPSYSIRLLNTTTYTRSERKIGDFNAIVFDSSADDNERTIFVDIRGIHITASLTSSPEYLEDGRGYLDKVVASYKLAR